MHTINLLLATEGVLGQASKAWVDYTHLSSDHHLVGATETCPRKVSRRKGKKPQRRRFRLDLKVIQDGGCRVCKGSQATAFEGG